jgi:hypothetical protein
MVVFYIRKKKEREDDISFFLGKLEDKAKKNWHSSGLRAQGIYFVIIEGLFVRRFIPHTLLQIAGSWIGVL